MHQDIVDVVLRCALVLPTQYLIVPFRCSCSSCWNRSILSLLVHTGQWMRVLWSIERNASTPSPRYSTKQLEEWNSRARVLQLQLGLLRCSWQSGGTLQTCLQCFISPALQEHNGTVKLINIKRILKRILQVSGYGECVLLRRAPICYHCHIYRIRIWRRRYDVFPTCGVLLCWSKRAHESCAFHY